VIADVIAIRAGSLPTAEADVAVKVSRSARRCASVAGADDDPALLEELLAEEDLS